MKSNSELGPPAISWGEYFVADFESGLLYWKISPARNVKAGDVVGGLNGCGYIQVLLLRRRYYAHRILWEMARGPIPGGLQVDHKNHKRSDNRLINLRLVTNQANQRNRSKQSKSVSGTLGVTWSERSRKWRAAIYINGKQIHLGMFTHLKDAIATRKVHEAKYNFHPNHGK